MTDTTKNTGGGASETTAFYLSTNTTFDAGDTRFGSRSVGPLAGGTQSIGSTSVVLPVVTPGTYYIITNADDGADVEETQENNNVRFTSIQIGPDLVSSVTAPITAVAGATITVNDTIRNYGANTAVGASTTRFYLSLNTTLDADASPSTRRGRCRQSPRTD